MTRNSPEFAVWTAIGAFLWIRGKWRNPRLEMPWLVLLPAVWIVGCASPPQLTSTQKWATPLDQRYLAERTRALNDYQSMVRVFREFRVGKTTLEDFNRAANLVDIGHAQTSIPTLAPSPKTEWVVYGSSVSASGKLFSSLKTINSYTVGIRGSFLNESCGKIAEVTFTNSVLSRLHFFDEKLLMKKAIGLPRMATKSEMAVLEQRIANFVSPFTMDELRSGPAGNASLSRSAAGYTHEKFQRPRRLNDTTQTAIVDCLRLGETIMNVDFSIADQSPSVLFGPQNPGEVKRLAVLNQSSAPVTSNRLGFNEILLVHGQEYVAYKFSPKEGWSVEHFRMVEDDQDISPKP